MRTVQSKTTDILGTLSTSLTREPTAILAASLTMAAIDWRIGLTVLGGATVSTWKGYRLHKKSSDAYKQNVTASVNLNGYVTEKVRHITTIQDHDQIDEENARLDKKVSESYTALESVTEIGKAASRQEGTIYSFIEAATVCAAIL